MEKGIVNFDVGTGINGQLLIDKATKGVASNGSPFLTLFLTDRTGKIEAKLWSVTEEQVESFTSGKVVNVEGVITEFRGNKQLKIQSISLCDDVDLSNFVKTAPVTKEHLISEIDETINNMENENIKNITAKIMAKHRQEFYEFPAAKSMHHNYQSGLAYHTVTMLKIAKSLADIYPELNKDLLYALIILHDIKKCSEYTGVINTERTLEGKLKGHLAMISEEIGITAMELGIEGEEVLLLQHGVGSHHGKLEWGSFVQPQIMEAEIVHFIDMIDAKMDMLRQALGKVEKGEFTERLRGLDNRSFYKPTI